MSSRIAVTKEGLRTVSATSRNLDTSHRESGTHFWCLFLSKLVRVGESSLFFSSLLSSFLLFSPRFSATLPSLPLLCPPSCSLHPTLHTEIIGCMKYFWRNYFPSDCAKFSLSIARTSFSSTFSGGYPGIKGRLLKTLHSLGYSRMSLEEECTENVAKPWDFEEENTKKAAKPGFREDERTESSAENMDSEG